MGSSGRCGARRPSSYALTSTFVRCVRLVHAVSYRYAHAHINPEPVLPYIPCPALPCPLQVPVSHGKADLTAYREACGWLAGWLPHVCMLLG
jgi:hypothetical protein